MDQTAAAPLDGYRPPPALGIGRWLHIRRRAHRVRRLVRRGDDWLDHVSPWAFWSLHR